MTLDDAFEKLCDWSANDPDPVSMYTEGDERHAEVSVVVLRTQPVIEMFRQWAERNFILRRDLDVRGRPRTPTPSEDERESEEPREEGKRYDFAPCPKGCGYHMRWRGGKPTCRKCGADLDGEEGE
jgi:hypothetical protein